MNRLVTIFLESAEFRVKQRQTLNLAFWQHSVDKLLLDHDVPLLKTKGSCSHWQAVEFAEKTYKSYDDRRKKYAAKQEDEEDIRELEIEVKRIGTAKTP